VSPDLAQEYHNLRAFLPFSTRAFISKFAVSMSLLSDAASVAFPVSASHEA
jgi:hypothetical protein